MITDRETIMAIVDNDCFTRSDAAVLLEGDGFFRFRKAVSLYKNGLVSKIVFSGNIVDKDYGSYPYEEVLPYILNEGVPEEDLARITEKYFRGANTAGRDGYGLGMYLVKWYMEKQDGGLEYYNDGGFVVELLVKKV